MSTAHLKSKGLTPTQKDLAKKIDSSLPNLSRAMKEDEEYLTDNRLLRINEAFNGIFNEDWLLTAIIYPPLEIPLNTIKLIYKATGVIKRNNISLKSY